MTLTQTVENGSFENERKITIRYFVKNGFMYVRSQMTDDHHDIFIYWKIGVDSYEIVEAEGRMDNKPFDDCSQSTKILKSLNGLVIGAGLKKNFRARFAREEGCTHISELSMATFDFIMARLMGPRTNNFSQEEKWSHNCTISSILCMNNSCNIFNQKNLPHFDEKGRYKGKDYDY